MPRKRHDHLDRVAVGGHVYWYFRRGKGPRTKLPGQPGSPEFEEAYAAALMGMAVSAKAARRQPDKPGTIGALVASYKRSAGYTGLRATTKTGYDGRLETIRVAHGHRAVAGLTQERIEKMLAVYSDRPGAALGTLKMLRVLINHALDLGLIKADPSARIKRPKGGEIRSWTEEEIAQFEAHWPAGTRERLAFALQLYTGQRRSDVHRMTWADVSGDKIRVVQQKTGAKLTITMDSELRELLALARGDRVTILDSARKHVTILQTAYGQPFTVDGYSGFMRDAIRAAGLPLDCRPHGLRKAAGRRLAEAGCTAHEIMSVLGHKSLAEAERYTRDAEQGRLARAASVKLEGQKLNRVSQTTPAGFGEKPEKLR